MLEGRLEVSWPALETLPQLHRSRAPHEYSTMFKFNIQPKSSLCWKRMQWKWIVRSEMLTCSVGCPSRTKFWSSDFCFAPKLNLGINNLKFLFQNFPTSGYLTPMSSKISTIFLYDRLYGFIAGISDDTEMKDPNVGKSCYLGQGPS